MIWKVLHNGKCSAVLHPTNSSTNPCFFCMHILKFLGCLQIFFFLWNFSKFVNWSQKKLNFFKRLWKNIWYFVKQLRNKLWLSSIDRWIKSLISFKVLKEIENLSKDFVKTPTDFNKLSRGKVLQISPKLQKWTVNFVNLSQKDIANLLIDGAKLSWILLINCAKLSRILLTRHSKLFRILSIGYTNLLRILPIICKNCCEFCRSVAINYCKK